MSTSTAFSNNNDGGGRAPQQQQPPPPSASTQLEHHHHQKASHKEEEDDDDDDGSDDEDSHDESSLHEASSSLAKKNKMKRPLMTHSKDGTVLSEKKLRRLEKNRLSARECRRRKREATEHLERQIILLEGENLRLRLQLQIGQEAEETMQDEQIKLTEDIDALLKSGASETEIYATLEEFKEKHADYGKSRRSAIEFHLRNIKRLLMPTQTTSFVMTAIQGVGNLPSNSHGHETDGTPTTTTAGTAVQVEASHAAHLDDDLALPVSPSTASVAAESALSDTGLIPAHPSTNLDPKALFQYLVNYLDVTPQQAAALKDSRFVAQELDGCLDKALGVLSELRDRLAQTGEDLETEFDNVRQILTPTQAAKFLVWVANNKACMHMLNELWDRVYPSSGILASAPIGDDDNNAETDS